MKRDKDEIFCYDKAYFQHLQEIFYLNIIIDIQNSYEVCLAHNSAHIWIKESK